MSDSYLSYIPCAHYGLKKQKRWQQKMAAAAATALVIAAQRHNIQARLFPLSSMMETSVETRGGLEFINIV